MTNWERADLLALLCVVFVVFCHFAIWFFGSVVVRNCIDLWVLPLRFCPMLYFKSGKT